MISEFFINNASSTPKYRQIVDSIINGIKSRQIGCQERLPSINEFSLEYDVSRDTVEKAYKQLKQQGVVISVPGKGYFTTAGAIQGDRHVLLLFNKLSAYKKAIFDGFMETVGTEVKVDIQVYHENLSLFHDILSDKRNNYSDYVIIPAFKGRAEIEARRYINQHLKNRRVWLLNTHLDGIENVQGEVVQNYENDIFNALYRAVDLLGNYKGLTLVFPALSNYSRQIISGFRKFCQRTGFENDVIWKDLESEPIQFQRGYIVLLDHDLVILIKKIRENNWNIGRDVGILAYNDSPLKEVLMDGISVISTDHVDMGRQMAEMILQEEPRCIENNFELILRKSL